MKSREKWQVLTESEVWERLLIAYQTGAPLRESFFWVSPFDPLRAMTFEIQGEGIRVIGWHEAGSVMGGGSFIQRALITSEEGEERDAMELVRIHPGAIRKDAFVRN